jgi:hypothetical protein
METKVGGILGRLGEKTLGWIILGLLILAGIGIWQAGPEWRATMWSRIWRTTVWVVIVGAVPWSAKLFIRHVVDAGTNWASAGLLAGLFVVDLIAALLLMTGWPGGVWGWLIGLAALAVAGTYNYLVTEYLSEMSGG